MNRSFVCSAPWLETLEVLKHEMAHQFVEEVLKKNEVAHGPAFRTVCEERGIDGRASGAPQMPREASSAMRKIEKLLSLGQSHERHEAEAAMRRAQVLLRRHNLKLLEAKTPREYTFRQLGAPRLRVDGADRWAAVLLSQHFFVEVIRISAFVPGKDRSGHVWEISGRCENLDIAEYVYEFLHRTADRLWEAHRSATQVSGRARARFREGVMVGFSRKLEAEASAIEEPSEKALVLQGDPQLRAYYRRRYPRISTTRRSGCSQDATHAAGVEAGKSIVLHRGMTSGGDGQRQLGSGHRTSH